MFRRSKINRDLKSLKRFWEIVETVTSYGFHEFVGQFAHARRTRWHRQHQLSGKSRPEKFRMLLEELGPTFVKLGQILSTRGDLIGREYADELAKLTENVAPFDYAEVEETIRRELGGAPEEIFSEFSREALAAASIGQVHSARLKDGSPVVVKVQRPDIREKIELDLAIIRYLAGKLETHNQEFAHFQPVRIVDEFAYSLRRELDYTCEGGNLLRFAKNLRAGSGVTAPRYYPEYSTVKVMTMERIFGDSCAAVLADPELKRKYDMKRIAAIGVDALLTQIFEDGFFHADPHPGNIFLLSGDRICFIDFGMTGRIGEAERRDFLKAITHMMRGEITLMTDHALRMTVSGTCEGSREDLERDLGDLIDANINLPLDKLSVAGILEKLLDILTGYRLALRPNLYMMCKALITVEHLGRSFDPEMRIVEKLKPFLLRQKLRSADPRPLLYRLVDEFGDNMASLQKLPRTFRNVLSQLERGELALRVEHHRLDDIEETMYLTGERLSRSLLLTAILLGSALIIVAKMPPFWRGVPIIGALGFAISGVVSVIVLWDDHRQRKAFLRERAKRKLISEQNRRR